MTNDEIASANRRGGQVSFFARHVFWRGNDGDDNESKNQMAARESQYWLTRFVIQRLLGLTYLIAFVIVSNQFVPLLGENGLLPARIFIERVDFWRAPSLFFLNASDAFFTGAAWCGIALSVLALTGLSDRFGVWVSVAVWSALWTIYLSFVNVGQTFYGFGWEMILLETGFLAIFFGSSDKPAPKLLIWLLRWLLFRIMFGAGLIKIRADPCWRDLTCLAYHYETQPVPNPLSWYFHWLPLWFHKLEVAFTHFVELLVPLGYFWPRYVRYATGGVTVLFQLILIASGNLSWLNYITLFIALACFDDAVFSRFIPVKAPESLCPSKIHQGAVIAFTVLVVILSIPPAINMLSSRQAMNASFNSLHLVNTYGAFGSVTRTRHEVIIEGTDATAPTASTPWKAYEFKCKPGDVSRRPCLMSPYLYKIDWQVWFAAMSDFKNHPWVLNLVAKLLQGDARVIGLLENDPFPDAPPKFIRATRYKYEFTTPEERRQTGNWWVRKPVGKYLPPLALRNPEFRRVLKGQGWLEE